MAITYLKGVADNGTITITGTGNSFLSLWNADKAGTFDVQTVRDITGVDGSPVAVSNSLRPTDYSVLGGNKLYILVTNYTTGPNTINIAGTDENANSINENISITANGTYNTTLFYHTVATTQVTGFGGNFRYRLTQAQWGVFWKTGTLQYLCDALIVLGNGTTPSDLKDKDKELVFSRFATWKNSQFLFEIKAAAILEFGQLDSAAQKATSHGCHIIWDNVDSRSYGAIVKGGVTGATTNIYSCIVQVNSPTREYDGGLEMRGNLYNSVLNRIITGGPNSNIDCWNIEQADARYGFFYGAQGTFNDIKLYSNMYQVYFYSNDVIILKNVIIRNSGSGEYTRAFTTYNVTADNYLINTDSDLWQFKWGGGANTGKIWRQYEYGLSVLDSVGSPISGATIILWNKNETQVFNKTTSNGTIPIQTVSEGWYEEATLDTLNILSPFHFVALKYGKSLFGKEMDFSEKTKDYIYLSTNPFITQSNPGTVAAYTGISVDHTGQTISVTQNHTMAELYDYLQYKSVIEPQHDYLELMATSDGINFTSPYSFNISGCTISADGKFLDLGIKNLTISSADFTGRIKYTAGTRVHLTLTGPVTDARCYIENASTYEVYMNELVTDTTATEPFLWTSDTSITVRVRKQGYLPFETSGVITQLGYSLQVTLSEDTTYSS